MKTFSVILLGLLTATALQAGPAQRHSLPDPYFASDGAYFTSAHGTCIRGLRKVWVSFQGRKEPLCLPSCKKALSKYCGRIAKTKLNCQNRRIVAFRVKRKKFDFNDPTIVAVFPFTFESTHLDVCIAVEHPPLDDPPQPPVSLPTPPPPPTAKF